MKAKTYVYCVSRAVSGVVNGEYDDISSSEVLFINVEDANAYAEESQKDVCLDPNKWINPKKTVQIEEPSQKYPFGKFVETEEDDTTLASYIDEEGWEHTVKITKIEVF